MGEGAAAIRNLPRPKGALLRSGLEEKCRLRVRPMFPADSSATGKALPSLDVSRRSPIVAAKSGGASRSSAFAKCLRPWPSGLNPGPQWWSNNPLNWSRRDPGGSSGLGGFGEAHRFGKARLTKPGGPVSLVVGLGGKVRSLLQKREIGVNGASASILGGCHGGSPAPIRNLPGPKGTLLRSRPEEGCRLRVKSLVPADSSAPGKALPSPDVSRRSPIVAARSCAASRSSVLAKYLRPRPSGFTPGLQWWSNNPLNWTRRGPGGSSRLRGFGRSSSVRQGASHQARRPS